MPPSPTSITTAFPDVVATSYWDSGFYASLGSGNFTYGPVPVSAAVGGAGNIVVADWNGDGVPDVAIASADGPVLSIVLGAGDGTFLNGPIFYNGSAPFAIATADFNGDGRPDVASLSPAYSQVYLNFGDGAGGFSGNAQVPLPNGNASRMLAGDFTGGGMQDLVLAGTSEVVLLPGNGDGTFAKPLMLSLLLGGLYGVAAGRFHAGHLRDFVVSGTSTTYLISLRKGQLAVTGSIAAAGSLFAGDFNRDGKPDLAIATAAGVSIYLGNGDGTFQAPKPVPLSNISPLTGGDWNHDGIPDLALLSAGISGFQGVIVLTGAGDGTFTAGQQLPVAPGAGGIVSADFNRDGSADIAVVQAAFGDVLFFAGSATGTFRPAVAFGVQAGPLAAIVTDLNLDGKPDLVVLTFDEALTGLNGCPLLNTLLP